MLKKLFIYDINAQRKLMFPFLLAMPAVGLLAMLLTICLDLLPEDVLLPYIGLGLLLLVCFLAVIVLYAICSFLVVMRYYKNLFSDEGYLTFSLPATMREQVMAKTLSGLTWNLLATVSLILSIMIGFAYVFFSLAGTDASSSGISIDIVFETLKYAFFGSPDGNTGMFILLLVLTVIEGLVGIVSNLLTIYLAITLGSLLWTKHKILGSVLFYFIVNTAISTLSQFISIGLQVLVFTDLSMAWQSFISMLITLIFVVAIGVVSYIITERMLEKRLNLE